MKPLNFPQKRGKYLSTHTHTHVAIVLLLILQSVMVQAQSPGTLIIPNAPVFDPITGNSHCTINWAGLTLTPLQAINIQITINGTSVCLNSSVGSDPTVIHSSFTPSNGFNISFTNNTLTIFKQNFSGFPPPPSPPYIPLAEISFRAEPGSNVTIMASGSLFAGTSIPIPGDIINWTMPSGFDASGLIEKPSGSAFSCNDFPGLGDLIPGVTVQMAPITVPGSCFPGSGSTYLAQVGAYDFFNMQYASWEITPNKSATDACCGITPSDVKWVQDYVLGILPNPLLWEVMAGDMNGNETTTTFDALIMAECVNGNPPPYLPSNWVPWRFCPYPPLNPASTPTWTGNNPDESGPASGVSFSNIPTSVTTTVDPPVNKLNAHFWGVKRGDVNGSCEICGGSSPNPVTATSDERTSSEYQTIQLKIDDMAIAAGQEVIIPVRSEAVEGLMLFFTELFLDTEKIELVEANHVAFTDEFALKNNFPDQNGEALRISWMNFELDGIEIDDNTTLFNLHLRAKKDIASLSDVLWQNLDNEVNAVALSGKQDFEKYQLGFESGINPVMAVRLTGSNPFHASTQVEISLPQNGEVLFQLINSLGTPVWMQKSNLSKGTHSIPIASEELKSPGVYSLHVSSPFGEESLRLVKQ
jgi:hypothetical protein